MRTWDLAISIESTSIVRATAPELDRRTTTVTTRHVLITFTTVRAMCTVNVSMHQTRVLVSSHLQATVITLSVLITSTMAFVTSTESTSIVRGVTAAGSYRRMTSATQIRAPNTFSEASATSTKRTDKNSVHAELLALGVNHLTATATHITASIMSTLTPAIGTKRMLELVPICVQSQVVLGHPTATATLSAVTALTRSREAAIGTKPTSEELRTRVPMVLLNHLTMATATQPAVWVTNTMDSMVIATDTESTLVMRATAAICPITFTAIIFLAPDTPITVRAICTESGLMHRTRACTVSAQLRATAITPSVLVSRGPAIVTGRRCTAIPRDRVLAFGCAAIAITTRMKDMPY